MRQYSSAIRAEATKDARKTGETEKEQGVGGGVRLAARVEAKAVREVCSLEGDCASVDWEPK